jgi:hypothetical protein
LKTLATTAGLALLLCACGVLADTGGGAPPGSIPTNMEVLEKLVHEVVDGVLDRMPLASGDVVLIRCSESHEISWMVEDYLAGRLASIGVSAYLDLSAPQAAEDGSQEQAAERGPKERAAARQDTTGGTAGAASGEGAFGSEAGSDTTAATEDSGGLDEGDTGAVLSDLGAQIQAAGESGVADSAAAQAPAEPASGGEKGGKRVATGRWDAGGQAIFEKAPVPDKVLDFRIGELEVDYTRRWRKSLFGSAMVERSARAAIFFRLLDGTDGRVLWTDSGRREKKDIVPQKILARLEDIPGLGPSAESGGGGITRVLEPLIVSGIVVGLVLLFYSSRT